MARIRSVKPETFTSETLTALPIEVRWTFVGLWTYVDDEGRGRADPRLVKAAVWPLDDAVSAREVGAHLDALEACSLICRYEADGKRYLHVVNFDEHQHPNRKSDSRLPECSRSVHGGCSEDAGSPPGRLPPVVVVGVVEGVGAGSRDAGAPNGAAAAAAQPNFGQRAEKITRSYSGQVKLSNHAAVKGLVAKAMRAGDWSDDEIIAALARLADDGRSVTADSLRYELAGRPPPNARAPNGRPSTDDKIRNTLALGKALNERQRKELAP